MTIQRPTRTEKLDLRLSKSVKQTLQAAAAFARKDDSAESFYRHFGFMPSPTVKKHLFLLNAPSHHYFFETIFECSEGQNPPFPV